MLLFFLILGISFLLQLFLPWWIIAPVAFGLALWKGTSAGKSFLAGFAALFVLWATAALVIHLRNEGILAAKIAGLFSLPFPGLLIPVAALIGGMVGGLAALSGFYWRKSFASKPVDTPKNRYATGESEVSTLAFKSRHDTA